MAWAPQGWAGTPGAHDELTLRLRQQLACRGVTGNDPTQLIASGLLPPGLASEHLLAQARQTHSSVQGVGAHSVSLQGGANVGTSKAARLPLSVPSMVLPGSGVNGGAPGHVRTAQLGLGRIDVSNSGTQGADGVWPNSMHSLGAPAPQNNQAALLAIMQSQLASQLQHGTGTIPAFPSMVQQPSTMHLYSAATNHTNLIAAAAATAAAQVANMRNAATLAARASASLGLPKRQPLGTDFPGISLPGAVIGQTGGVLSQAGMQQPGWGAQAGFQSGLSAQPNLANPGLQLQLARGLGLGLDTGTFASNGRPECRLGNFGNVENNGMGMLGKGISAQGSVGGGYLQTGNPGLPTPSIMASAPMLPILGEDLARPHSQNKYGHISTTTGSVPLMSTAAVGMQSTASWDSSSVKSSDTATTLGSSVCSPKLSVASEAQILKLKSNEGIAASAPMGALDMSNLTKSQVNALLHAQADEIRALAAQFGGLLGQPAASTIVASGAPAVGVPSSGVAESSGARSGMHRERDMSTLKTLGQMLARTGNTVESAVQTGLLGGCNAEDVKVVWEAFAIEMAALKQAANAGNMLSLEVPKGRHLGTSVVPQGSDSFMATGLPQSGIFVKPPCGEQLGGVIGDKRDVSSESDDSAGGPQTLDSSKSTSQPSLPLPHVDLCEKDGVEEEEEEEPNWDEVFENEEGVVRPHVISTLNDDDLANLPAEVGARLEVAFDAFSYGFFGEVGEGECAEELLEEDDMGDPEQGGETVFMTGSDNEHKLAGWALKGEDRDGFENEPVRDLLCVGTESNNDEESGPSNKTCCSNGDSAIGTGSPKSALT